MLVILPFPGMAHEARTSSTTSTSSSSSCTSLLNIAVWQTQAILWPSIFDPESIDILYKDELSRYTSTAQDLAACAYVDKNRRYIQHSHGTRWHFSPYCKRASVSLLTSFFYAYSLGQISASYVDMELAREMAGHILRSRR